MGMAVVVDTVDARLVIVELIHVVVVVVSDAALFFIA
jgi:hypothetical protein